MNTKSKTLLAMAAFMVVLFVLEVSYIQKSKRLTPLALKHKNDFISLVQLPDLAIATEATYIRHRTLSDVFSIYKDDGVLREYFVSTYTIANSYPQK